MTIFEVASEHSQRYGNYAAGASSCLLLAGRIMAHDSLPPIYLVVAYILLGVAVRYIVGAAVYTGYTVWAAGSMLPPVYGVQFEVDGSDLPMPRPDLERAAQVPQAAARRQSPSLTPVLPMGQPVRATAPSVAPGGEDDGDVRPRRTEFIGGGAVGVVSLPDVFEDYPDIKGRVMRFIADRPDTLFSANRLGEAGVVSRDSRVLPNGSMVIDSLERAGYIRKIGQQFILTEAGKSLVTERG